MRRIYVVGTMHNYANWMKGELVNSIEEADLVVFTGGEDVDPIVYNEKQHPSTYSNFNRDVIEITAFQEAISQGKHIIGICRGLTQSGPL